MTEFVHLETPSAPARGCSCGAHDEEVPVLDVRLIPHAIRHAAVFGAFDAIRPGASLVIVAPHAPTPLLNQLASRALIVVEYLVEGPTEWHVKITRLDAED
jgi:uncharacterized protein (DUF2249 family)